METFPLSEFIGRPDPRTRRWDYKAGQHVTVLAPTDWGKTHLSYELLSASATPQLPAINLVIKPRDSTALRFAREHDMPRVQTYPLPPNPMRRKRSGWTVWPTHTFDDDRDDERLYRVCIGALSYAYKKGNHIVFADEAAGLIELDPPRRGMPTVERRLKRLYGRGRSMGTGVWTASQRPVDIPLLAYSMASHLFLGNDPDVRGRKRYDEIGGVDAGMVSHETSLLQKRHWLYIMRHGPNGPCLCIITPG